MISLVRFVKESYEELDLYFKELDEMICKHLAVEFPMPAFLNEKYGEMTKISMTVDDIVSDIFSSEESEYLLKCECDDNFPFKTILMNVSKNDSEGLHASFDKNDYSASECCMSINVPENSPEDDIKKLLQHEFLHAIEDWGREHSKGRKMKDIHTPGYGSAFNAMKQNITEIEKLACNVLYFFNEAEIRAYASRLRPDIKKIMNDNHWNANNCNVNRLKDELKKNPIWKTYYDTCAFIEKFLDGSIDEKSSEEFMSFINNRIKTDKGDKMNDSELRADIKKRFNHFMHTMNKLIPKICAECQYDINYGLIEGNYLFEKKRTKSAIASMMRI